MTADGRLVIHVPNLAPERRPCRHASAFKLTGFEVALRPEPSSGPRAEKTAPGP